MSVMYLADKLITISSVAMCTDSVQGNSHDRRCYQHGAAQLLGVIV